MPSAKESLGAQSQIESSLDSGVQQVAAKQTVTFGRYQRYALASDGFVFWAATGETMKAVGSLHYATDRQQSEDETIAQNQMIFNSETEITQLNAESPTSMWIGSWNSADPKQPALRVAFARRGNYFAQSNIWHYSGFAIYPAMQTQIVDSPADLPAGPIVSNSLPIWLAQTSFAGQTVAVFPSFLVPDNLVPPYIVVHVEPGQTQALSAFPMLGPWPGDTVPNSGASPLHQIASSQLMRDEVTLTLYGFSNQMAVQYLQALIDTSLMTEVFGFANSPAIRDEKRPQVELAALAQKKTIVISANYLQGAADATARRLLLSASIASISYAGGRPAQGVVTSAQDEQLITAQGAVHE